MKLSEMDGKMDLAGWNRGVKWPITNQFNQRLNQLKVRNQKNQEKIAF